MESGKVGVETKGGRQVVRRVTAGNDKSVGAYGVIVINTLYGLTRCYAGPSIRSTSTILRDGGPCPLLTLKRLDLAT